jgi:hypothetical protein
LLRGDLRGDIIHLLPPPPPPPPLAPPPAGSCCCACCGPSARKREGMGSQEVRAFDSAVRLQRAKERRAVAWRCLGAGRAGGHAHWPVQA